MKFRKLTIENYKSYRGAVEIPFPESEEGRGIFLIGGMNGAGKTSVMEAVNACLYGAKAEEIFKNINRRVKAEGDAKVSFELVMETDDGAELVVNRSWTAGDGPATRARDLAERLTVTRDGKRVSVQTREILQDFLRSAIPPGITQFFFFDGEKIQEIAADDHFEVRLKSSLEAALGLQVITRLAADLTHIRQEERKGSVDITDEDMEFKQSELKKERSALGRKQRERDEAREELEGFRAQLNEAKKRFKATFQMEPESRETLRAQERRRAQAAARLTQVEAEIRALCEKTLPFALAGGLFPDIRRQIEAERGAAGGAAIREHAEELAGRLARVVDEPEPVYPQTLTPEQRAELERRFARLLREGENTGENRLLDLSERDAARLLNRMESLEQSDIFRLQPLLEEKRELAAQVRALEDETPDGMGESEREIFEQLQAEMESCQTQIGRQTERLRRLEGEIPVLEKRVADITLEIERLYEKHDVSKERAEFIAECDAAAAVLNDFIVRLRRNKVHLLQEKTFEMYRRLSSRGGLVKDLTIDGETYEVRISDRDGHEIRKSALSAGEKEVFALSLLWGLAQTSRISLPIIIDTPLSRLDSAHRDNIVHNYFPNAGEQVVILSTDTEIDKDYYRGLEPRLCGAGSLVFDRGLEQTTFQSGYFWEA